jgi:hypothetical protein
MNRLILACALALLPLSACATLEPKPCSAEWFDYKTEKTLRKFALQNRGLVSELKNLADAEGDINPIKALTLVSKAKDFEKLASSFEKTVLPELDNAMTTCGSNAEFVPAFTEFLRDEGVSEKALEWVAPFVGLMQSMRELEKEAAKPAAPK